MILFQPAEVVADGRVKITYELLDVHHDANKGNLLLLYALCHQVVLEKVRVVDVGANVALFSLFPPKSFL